MKSARRKREDEELHRTLWVEECQAKLDRAVYEARACGAMAMTAALQLRRGFMESALEGETTESYLGSKIGLLPYSGLKPILAVSKAREQSALRIRGRKGEGQASWYHMHSNISALTRSVQAAGWGLKLQMTSAAGIALLTIWKSATFDMVGVDEMYVHANVEIAIPQLRCDVSRLHCSC